MLMRRDPGRNARGARRFAAAALLATLVLAGCGGGDQTRTTSSAVAPAAAGAQSYDKRSPIPGNVDPVTPADLRQPIATYRQHVRRQLTVMRGDLRALRRAVAASDRAAARAAWLRAQYRYETIGAAYGAFGALDQAVNGRAGGLQGGVRSTRFSGLHRVEMTLWGGRPVRAAAGQVARLDAAVARLRRHVGTAEIDPLDYVLRSHEVLEDTLALQLSDQASPWSGAALNALDGNIAGTRLLLRTIDGLAGQRDPVVVQQCWRAIGRLQRALDGVRRGGRLPRWDALGQRDRERISGLTAAAAEALAFVPELVDPRPPRPLKRSIETGGPSR